VTFEDWWKAGTSTEVPLYGEANAKKAWDHQQTRIEELEAENKLLVDHSSNQIIAELKQQLAELRGLQDKLEDIYSVLAAHIKRLLEEGK